MSASAITGTVRSTVVATTPPPRTAGTALRCSGVTKAYRGGVVVLRGISLSVARGECVGLLGPNGAGKTTTIEILEGLSAPTTGDVEVLGRTWARHERELRERVGITLQGTRLPEKLTVGETLGLFASFYRRPLEPRAVLESLGLDTRHDARVRVLSEGQRQRLAIACALIGQPELLFLDEPTTGLDPQSRQRLWRVIQDYGAAGGTVMLTTNNMDEAERLCHRVAIIDAGAVVATDAPSALVAQLGAGHIVEFSITAAREAMAGASAALAALPGVVSARREEHAWCLLVEDVHRAVAAVTTMVQGRGLSILNLSARSATLEDVFLERTGRRFRHD